MIVADDDQCVELGAPHGIPEMGDPGLRLGMAGGEPLRCQFGCDMRLRSIQQLFVCRRLPLFVEEVANRVAIDEARPILGRGVEHRRVRRADPEDELGHTGCSFPLCEQ